MGLFSKFKHSEEESATDATRNDTNVSPTPPSSSMASPKVVPQLHTSSASNSTLSEAPRPGYGSGSNSHWPAVPHSGDYKARIAQMDEDSKLQPHKKNWVKEKLDLADPTEKEYYERRYTASGKGSDFERVSQMSTQAIGGLAITEPRSIEK